MRRKWGVLGTASAAFLHSERDKVPRVADQSRGHETPTEVYLPPIVALAYDWEGK